MPRCKRPNGDTFECSPDCRLPWLCPAAECFDATRAEYIARNRAAFAETLADIAAEDAARPPCMYDAKVRCAPRNQLCGATACELRR